MNIVAKIHRIAARIIGYDFRTKMKINALVLEEVSRVSGISDMEFIAEHMANSPAHEAIQKLADAVQHEVDELKTSKK